MGAAHTNMQVSRRAHGKALKARLISMKMNFNIIMTLLAAALRHGRSLTVLPAVIDIAL